MLNSLVSPFNNCGVLVYILVIAAYKSFGSTCLSSVLFWDLTPVFWLTDADAIKIVSYERQIFQKDLVAVTHSHFLVFYRED